MDCKLCLQLTEAHREGKLTPGLRTQVDAHLEACRSCSMIYRDFVLSERVIRQEKELQPDPYLATRIMAEIESLQNQDLKASEPAINILRPALITVSLAAAVAFGIIIGNLSVSTGRAVKMPSELALTDDNLIESLDVLALE